MTAIALPRQPHSAWLERLRSIQLGLGAAAAAFGLLSMAGLVLAREFGYGGRTAPLVSLGVVGLATVLAWGALRLLVGGWRSE